MRSTLIRHILRCVSLALLLTGTAWADTITGVVTDSDGEPIPSVSVITDVTGFGTMTDTDGRFTLDLVDREVTRVTFSSVGYHPRQFLIGRVPGEVVLESRYYPGGNIVVRADRASKGVSPVSFDDYTAEEISRDYTVADPPMLLNMTPNFYSFSDGGGNLGYTYTQIRGFDDKRLAVYINGVPLNDPEDQYNYWVDLPDFTSSVDDIQIQRGVGNSLYGDASFGGTINVVTNTLSQERMARLTAGFGEFLSDGKSVGETRKQTVEYASGLIDGRWSFTGRYSKQYTDGYRENAWVDQWAYFFSVARLDPNMSTELYVFGGPMRLRLTFYGTPMSVIDTARRHNPLTYDNETDNFSQPHYHLINKWRVSDDAVLTNTFYYIRGKGHYEQFRQGASFADYNIDTSVTGGVEFGDVVQRQLVTKHHMGWNPRLDIEHERGHHAIGGSFYYFESTHWGEVTWASNIVGELGSRHPYYRYYGFKKVASLFAEEYYKLTDKLAAQATVQLRLQRYDFEQDRMGAFPGYTYDVDWLHVSPRLGLNYQLAKVPGEYEASVYTNFAVASRTPADVDIYDANTPGVFPSLEIEDSTVIADGVIYQFGDPTFETERVYDFELGGTYQTPKYSLSANLYWMDFDNEIINYGGINPNTGQVATVNADGSYRAGIELSAKWQATDALSLGGNFSLNRYRIKDFVDTLTVYDDFYNEIGEQVVEYKDRHGLAFPEWLGNLVASYATDRYGVTLRVQGAGKQYMEFLNVDSLAIDPFVVASLTGRYTFDDVLGFGDLTLTGTVDNLFDKKYVRSGYGWNGAYAPTAGDPVTVYSVAEYYVAAERSYYVQLSWEFF